MPATISPPAIPPSVANANALLASADAPADSARAMTAKANTMLLAAAAADKPVEAQAPDEAAVVASDELNDVDRALQQTASTQTVALAAAKPATAASSIGQRQFALGSDLADWKNLHRLRRIADDGFGRAHVHGVRCLFRRLPTALGPDAARSVRSRGPLTAT